MRNILLLFAAALFLSCSDDAPVINEVTRVVKEEVYNLLGERSTIIKFEYDEKGELLCYKVERIIQNDTITYYPVREDGNIIRINDEYRNSAPSVFMSFDNFLKKGQPQKINITENSWYELEWKDDKVIELKHISKSMSGDREDIYTDDIEYDKNNNPVKITREVRNNGNFSQLYTTDYEYGQYDSPNKYLPIECVLALRTQDDFLCLNKAPAAIRSTRKDMATGEIFQGEFKQYAYTYKEGRVESITWPGGTKIIYTYQTFTW